MARYGNDLMGRVRQMWDRISDPWEGNDGRRRRPMQATGPGAEGYFLSPEMARQVAYDMEYDDGGWDGGHGRTPGASARFGGADRGYGGDYRTGRGGYDAGEFFVNRQRGGGTGYHPGYERDLGMRGMNPGRHGYVADYARGGFRARYDGGYRGGPGGFPYGR